MATPVVLTTGARPIVPVESGGVPMTPVDTLGEPVTVVDTLGEPVVLINNDGTPAFLAYSAKTYLGGVAPYHWLDFINNRALYAGADVGNVTQATGYSFTRASTGYYQNADGTLTLFGSGALRRGDRGVLIEGSRTNLLLRSQEFDNVYWAKDQIAVTSNASSAPDNTMTADKIAVNAGVDVPVLYRGVTLTAASYTFSVYAKAGEQNWLAVRFDPGTNKYTWFNLSAGTIGTSDASHTAKIEALANGWYRCSVTVTATAALWYCVVIPTTGNDVSVYSGDGTSGLFLWGAQLEAASFPSSYIPTVAAAATRAADVLTYTAGVSYPLSLWAEFERAVDAASNDYIFQIEDGSADRIGLLVSSGNVAGAAQVSGNVSQASLTVSGALALNTVYKSAARSALNDVQMARGGTLATADTSASVPAAPNLLRVGSFNSSSNQLFGYIRRAAVFNSALTDAQLQTTTS